MPSPKGDLRKTHRYQVVRRIVLAQEPVCWLKFAGCTQWSATADHVIPVKECMRLGRPDLVTARENCRGACGPCNYARHDKPVEAIRHLMGMAAWYRQPLRAFD